jgi:parallel beta-helix repeat protein
MQKRSVIGIFVFSVLVLSVFSFGFASAGFFGDLLNSITGKAVQGSTEEGVCFCVSCSDCMSKLGDEDCLEVVLTNDIKGDYGHCINNPEGFTNKVFDCQEYEINGDGDDLGIGIYLNGKNENIIRNCKISDFNRGIYVKDSLGNLIRENVLENNLLRGIHVDGGQQNEVQQNVVSGSTYGLQVVGGTQHSFISNTLCDNSENGLRIQPYDSRNVFNDNTCESAVGGEPCPQNLCDSSSYYCALGCGVPGCVDNCGNGVCEEIVCTGIECSCKENSESCPADCPVGSVEDCTDSDGGLDYFKKGVVNDLNSGNVSYTDFCLESGTSGAVVDKGEVVREHYCGLNNYQYEYYECPRGCEDGACACDVLDVLVLPGFSKNLYLINDKEYDVSLIFGTSTEATFEVNGEQKAITEGSSKIVDGLDVYLISSTESTAEEQVSARFCLNACDVLDVLVLPGFSKNLYLINDKEYDVSLIFGTSTEATFEVNGEQKAITEGSSKIVDGLDVYLISSTESTAEEQVSARFCLNAPDKTYTSFCDDLSGDIILKIRELQEDENYEVILREGDEFGEDDWVVFGRKDYAHILQAVQIYNNTGNDYTRDQVKLQDVFNRETYAATFTSEGEGTVSVDGKSYTVEFSGSGDDGVAKIFFPTSDSGEDELISYEDCELKTCESLMDIIKNPPVETIKGKYSEFKIESIWNRSRENYDYYTVAVSDERFRDEGGFSLKAYEFSEGAADEDILERLARLENAGLCSLREYFGRNSVVAKVYVCVAPWEFAEKTRDSNWGNMMMRAYWFNLESKVLFEITDWQGAEDYYEDRERRFEDNQEEILEFLDNLIDYDSRERVPLYLSSLAGNFIGWSAEMCLSDVSEGQGNWGSWSCELEPLICPPHGSQRQTCARYNYGTGEDEKWTDEIRCNPGICAGCYVPRWFDQYVFDQESCIPYGFRFEHQTGWEKKLYEFVDVESMAEGDYGEVSIEVLSAETAVITFFGNENTNLTLRYEMNVGKSVEVDLSKIDEGEHKMTLTLKEVFYSSAEDAKNSVVIHVKSLSWRNFPEYANMYCDIDGRMKEQKIREYDGSWARCQNNYECDSNLCSGGECVEIGSLLDQASGFKSLGVRVLCRFASVLGIEDYANCVNDYLGDEVEHSVEEPKLGGDEIDKG